MRTVIAEDDFRVANIHENFLQRYEEIHVVGKALNAKETMEILKKEKPDLLLLDVYMPDKSGVDLLPEIRKEHPDIDIIVITASTDKDILNKALHYGVESFLIKPVKMERFSESIEQYLRKISVMEDKQEINQELVDIIYSRNTLSITEKEKEADLPKGIDEITLTKVRNVLDGSKEGLSAEQVSDQIGASRTTARRYLEYLISSKECKAEVVYGSIGRPQRKYFRP
ncbi:response regulator [Oceanobacillus piezotolerans]|uniref:response regulator n=1 Tax=Oceanobacillus piezotolerans TaxID=2448030 RepID=UPI001FE4A579|nr:response regulator [Oceanobacillus piezotolerans]